MALLCAHVDTNINQNGGTLAFRCYVPLPSLQAFPLMRSLLAPLMLQGGSFTLPPGHDLPINTAVLLGSIPEAATTIIDDIE
jgi:hypothetical protein